MDPEIAREATLTAVSLRTQSVQRLPAARGVPRGEAIVEHMPSPVVDVVIPVHTATRPIRRAASSALANETDVRVIVVAHNIDPARISEGLGDLASDPRVRLLSLLDGIASPAGPMNHGIAEGTGRYFAVMGSDDELEPGAIDSWASVAIRTGATAVLPRILVGGRPDPTPPTRRGRTRDLDPEKDRLSYRCMPLGLIERERFGHLRFTEGLASGEDLEFTAQLWFTGSQTAYDRSGPAYIVHDDTDDRVTRAIRPLAEDFAFLGVVERSEWWATMSAPHRRAFGVKNLRMHVMDAVASRLVTADGGIAAHAAELVDIVTRIEVMSPGSTALLSRADRKVLRELSSEIPSVERIKSYLAARWGARPDAVLTANPLRSLHRQAPLRTLRDMVA